MASRSPPRTSCSRGRCSRRRASPIHRSHYGNVERAEITSPAIVHFSFKDNGNREAPLLLGLMPILPRAPDRPRHLRAHHASQPPVGSGPYVVERGRSRPQRRLPAQPQMVGREQARQPRPLQFRRDPLRVFPRSDDAVRGVQGRRGAICASRMTPGAGPKAMHFRPSPRDASSAVEIADRAAGRHDGAGVQHAPPRVRRRRACARR